MHESVRIASFVPATALSGKARMPTLSSWPRISLCVRDGQRCLLHEKTKAGLMSESKWTGQPDKKSQHTPDLILHVSTSFQTEVLCYLLVNRQLAADDLHKTPILHGAASFVLLVVLQRQVRNMEAF